MHGSQSQTTYSKALFDRPPPTACAKCGRHKAIVAIARKLLVVVWHVLAEKVADREAVPEKVAEKFLEQSWKVGRANRRDLTAVAFIRRQLLQSTSATH